MERELEFERWQRGRVPRLTAGMRVMMAAVELAGSRPVSEVRFGRTQDRRAWVAGERKAKRVLRELIGLGLIEVMSLSPARYRVTRLGRLARELWR